MKTEVLIPQQGLTSEEVTILEIFKKVGDRVEKGDELFQMESEKSNFPLESPVKGTIVEIRVKEQDEVSIGMVALVIEEDP
ncbi:MAG: biotin/lipoyl-containing protein [Spirochaetota bacterium]